MRCERAQELFSDYYEGSIQTALTVPLENHLRTCSGCRDEYEGLKIVWPVLDAAPIVDPPSDFRALVWQKIDAAEASRQSEHKPLIRFDWHSLFPKPALGWAAAALAVIALAPFAVRGNFTPAGLGGVPFLARTLPTPIVGEPQVVDEGGTLQVKVHVQNPGSEAIRVGLSSESEIKLNRQEIVVPGGSNGWFTVGALRSGETRPAQLKATWSPSR